MKQIVTLLCFVLPIVLNAQTNFAGLGTDNSGGTGFKTVQNNSNIVVSNIMISDNTVMYYSGASSGYTATFTVKADGTNSNFFTFEDMNFSAFADLFVDAANSSIAFYDKDDGLLQTMTLNSNKGLRVSNGSTSIVSFFDNGTTVPINNVAKIVFRVYQNSAQSNQQNSANFNFEDITLSNYLLPVELTSFNANVLENKINLSWQTATEVNNYGFEIERMKNNIWEKIGFVEGHGNSNSPKDYTFTDQAKENGKYSYRLKQIDFDGKFEYSDIVEVDFKAINDFVLEQNYPNPFNPATSISYSIPQNEFVTLKVYDVIGNEVATLVNTLQESGKHDVTFNASNLSSGIYFYKLTAGNSIQIKKMMLVK